MKKIAYLILAHSDADQLGKLCKTLDDEYADIFIHIDAKVSIRSFSESISLTNARIINTRFSVTWGGISMVDAQNELVKEALNYSQNYSHVVFLSGNCYPIKRSKQIHGFLISRDEVEFIKYIDMRKSAHHMKKIEQKWFKEPFVRRVDIGPFRRMESQFRDSLTRVKFRQSWKSNLIPYFGSQWCALTPNCCRYIIEFQEKNPWYRKMFKYLFAPDEIFFHTIIGNSEFARHSTGIQEFTGLGAWRMANIHLMGTTSKWFSIGDWKEIENSDMLFVRKVRGIEGTSLVRAIDKNILK